MRGAVLGDVLANILISTGHKVTKEYYVNDTGSQITILGKVFDAQPLLKSLYKKSDKKTFSKNFNSEVKVNLDKTITGTNDDISNFAMIASINNGSYVILSSKGTFSKNEIVEMSIYQVDEGK